VVRANTIRDETYQGLVERITGISELLLNSGNRIIAIMGSPMPLRETEWVATIFSEFDQDDPR